MRRLELDCAQVVDARLDGDGEAALGPRRRVQAAHLLLPGLKLPSPDGQFVDAEAAIGRGDGRVGIVARQDERAFPGMVIAGDMDGRSGGG